MDNLGISHIFIECTTTINMCMSELQTGQQEIFDYIKNNLGEGMVDVEFMPGLNMLDELGQFKISYGSNYNSLSIGPVKIMLSSSSGRFVPEPQDLLEFVAECHDRGYPVAIHAITENEIDLCLSIFSKSSLRGDRIEHASELRDDQIKKIAK